jgi:hypothetical protein
MHGFIVTRLAHKYGAQFYAEVPALLADGTLRCVPRNGSSVESDADVRHTRRCQEHRYAGLDRATHALVDVLTGKNEGKAVVVVAEE